MLKLKFIVVDRTRAYFLRDGESEYLKRLKRYVSYKWIEVKPVKITKHISDEELMTKEGNIILSKIDSGDYVIALDRKGKQYSSKGLATYIKRLSVDIAGYVCLVIGGPVGLSKDILERADSVMSMSRLTLTHEMVRLLLIEQIYRAFTILEGHKYHR